MMAERQNRTRRSGAQINVIGNISVPASYGPAKATLSFGRALDQLGNALNNHLDRQAEQEGTEAGKQAGASGEAPVLKNAATIRGQAFNRAAVSTYVNNVELRARQRVNELYDEHKANPAELEKQLSAYAEGVGTEIGNVDISYRDVFMKSFDTLSKPYVARAKDAAFKLAQSRAEASLFKLEAQTDKDIDQLAEGLLSDNHEVQKNTSLALGTHLERLRAQYSAVDPATGLPLFSPEDLAEAQQRFYDRTLTSGVRAWFRDHDNKAEAIMAIREGTLKIGMTTPGPNGELELQAFDVRSNLSIEALDRLEGALVRDLNFEHTMRERAEAETDKAIARRQDLAAFEMWERVYRAGQPDESGGVILMPSAEEISGMVDDGALDPADAGKILDGVLNQFAERDDVAIIDALETRMYDGEDISDEIQEFRSSITSATASRLRGLNQTQIRQRAGTFNPRNEQRKLLRDQLSSGSLLDIEPADVKARKAAALTEFDLRSRDIEDPSELAALREELVTRASRSFVLDATASLVKPRFSVDGDAPGTINVVDTVRKLAKMRDSGIITQAQYEQQLVEVQKWKTAQDENERLRNRAKEQR